MSMIERVARAMETKRREEIARPLSMIWHELAEAAIEAMREPTDEMVADGSDIVQAWDATAETAWKAMIDAALK